MQYINMHNAKTHLSHLVELLDTGEEIVICKSGKPVAKLVKYEALGRPRRLGLWKEQVQIAEDFDEANADIEAMFEGKLN